MNNPSGVQVTLFNGSFIIDNLSSFMKILTILGGASILLMSKKFLKIAKNFYNSILSPRIAEELDLNSNEPFLAEGSFYLRPRIPRA